MDRGMERPILAVHRTIVVVDVEGFGDHRRTSPHQVAVRAGLYQVLQQAFEQAGVSWADCEHEDRGDGVFVLVPAEIPKALFAGAMPDALVTALREHNIKHAVEARIRLRMALHAGEITYDQHGVTAVAVNLAFRLLDSAPLKTALAESPGVLAVISSGWFFGEVVRHSPASDAATYRPVQVTVKETSTVAWVSLPDYPYPPNPAHLTAPPAGHLTDPIPRWFSVPRALTATLAGTPFDDPPVPRQLPPAIRDFTGRAEHLAILDALLLDDHTGQIGATGAVVISAIDGTAGVGKTTLAVHWAHRVQHQFPNGTLYVNLRGYGPGRPATPTEVLGGFLHALGCPPQRIPIGLDAQSALYRSLLAGRQVLIVLDNANTAQQVRPLLPGSPECLVLITSRASLTGLMISDAATRLTLDLLTHTEALDLVRGILGASRVAAEPHAVTELIRMCARLPLALRIAAARAANHPQQPIADVVADMDVDRTRLDALSTPGDDPTSVRTVFDWSYRRLDTGPAQVFRRLGLHPGPEISLHAAAAVAALDLTETRRLLDALTDANLLGTVARDRYRLHDLLRAYAADRAEHDDPSEDRDHARRALLEWYAHHSAAARLTLYPAHAEWDIALDTHANPLITFSGVADAWTWMATEQANLNAAAHHAADHDLPDLAFLISHTNCGKLVRGGDREALLDLSELGLAAARRSGDHCREYHALLGLASVHDELGRWAEAIAGRQKALTLARTLGEPWLEAATLNDLGSGFLRRERYTKAIEYLRQALPLSPGAQRGRLEGVIEGNLGDAYLGLGNYEQALSHLERGLTLRQQAGDWVGQPGVLNRAARARQGMGDHAEAIALCEHALSIGRDHGYPLDNAAILDALGTSLQHTSDLERAITCWREALDTFDRFADPRAAGLRARLQVLETTDPRSGSVPTTPPHPAEVANPTA